MLERDMPRRAVVSKIADAHNMSKVEAELVLRTALSGVAEQVSKRGRFHVAEIGSIAIVKRKPRRYFNPRTQKESVSKGDVALKIKISKSMKQRALEEDK